MECLQGAHGCLGTGCVLSEERGIAYRMDSFTVFAEARVEAGSGAERTDWSFEHLAQRVLCLDKDECGAEVRLWLESLGGCEHGSEASIRGEALQLVIDHAHGKWRWL